MNIIHETMNHQIILTKSDFTESEFAKLKKLALRQGLSLKALISKIVSEKTKQFDSQQETTS